MDTRGPQGFVPIVAATEPRTRRGSTATDLPRAKSVEPLDKASPSRAQQLADDEARRARQRETAKALRSQSELDVKTHAATGSLVVQTRDPLTGNLMHQFPNNATLKQRAIARYEALQGTPTIKRTV